MHRVGGWFTSFEGRLYKRLTTADCCSAIWASKSKSSAVMRCAALLCCTKPTFASLLCSNSLRWCLHGSTAAVPLSEIASIKHPFNHGIVALEGWVKALHRRLYKGLELGNGRLRRAGSINFYMFNLNFSSNGAPNSKIVQDHLEMHEH